MEYLAHIDRARKQTNKEHLYGTALLAGDFAERFGKWDWGYCCGMLHDIGKYSAAFQEKIQNDSNKQVDHSTAGAQVCAEKGGMYGFMSYCIAGHHSGLPDRGGSSDAENAPTLEGRKKKKIFSQNFFQKSVDKWVPAWYYSQALEREADRLNEIESVRTLKIKQRDERRTRDF